MKKEVKIKRIYEAYQRSDGFRILVDRLWPRGIKKETAHIDAWMKEVAPSTALRNWFNHQPEHWEKFRERYLAELAKSEAAGELLQCVKSHPTVSLLYGARDEEHNQAVVLRQYINDLLP